ncbi:LPS assembly lipoprotein LptE [Ectothiorhodospira mobilis]|uniref:LPS-assembly lipoprotein LptE n=1 Tax=Ectothiorhodospira mobilis TaxID=195064 RepID=UPI001EE785FE|nr:LPS assembly lipoprotein LptE [Ectothiorhodospira mobilis]MCG5536402.1 LPS assembly lipoprotein LptE [Ectothiorhodospira mobilis]
MNRRAAVLAGVLGTWLAALALLPGCGFQLRQSGVLPPAMAHTALTGLDAGDPLHTELRLALEARGAELVPLEEADARLEILERRQGRRALSVGGDGRVSEYEVRLRLVYRVEGEDTEFSIPRQTLELTRDYLFDASGVLGRAEQERVLYDAMRRDAVQLMMIRLQNAAR